MEHGRPLPTTSLRPFCALMMAIITALLVACSGNSLRLMVDADHHSNPDSFNAGLPLVVRAYLLSNQRAFATANFQSLWKHPTETLGSSMISSETWVVAPGVRQKFTIKRKAGAQFLGVMALFREAGHTSWRQLVVLHDPVNSWLHPIHILIRGNRLRIVGQS